MDPYSNEKKVNLSSAKTDFTNHFYSHQNKMSNTNAIELGKVLHGGSTLKIVSICDF